MLAKEITTHEWLEVCNKIGLNTIFGKTKFTKVYSEIYNLKIHYFTVNEGYATRLAIACFSNGKSIVFPNHYMFTALGIDANESEISRIKAITVLIEFLKKKFTDISFRLPVEFKDVRPFIWQGFTSTHKYTYIKNINDLDYHTNIKRILKKGTERYVFKVTHWDTDTEEIHTKDFFDLKFSKYFTNKVMQCFKQLQTLGVITIFNGYLENKLVGSDILLIDKGASKAYMFFISKSHNHYKTGFPALMYDFVFQYLKTNGIEMVDMFGANMQHIAAYKSKFNPQLTDFFEVRYSAKAYQMRQLKDFLKLVFKKIMFR